MTIPGRKMTTGRPCWRCSASRISSEAALARGYSVRGGGNRGRRFRWENVLRARRCGFEIRPAADLVAKFDDVPSQLRSQPGIGRFSDLGVEGLQRPCDAQSIGTPLI